MIPDGGVVVVVGGGGLRPITPLDGGGAVVAVVVVGVAEADVGSIDCGGFKLILISFSLRLCSFSLIKRLSNDGLMTFVRLL